MVPRPVHSAVRGPVRAAAVAGLLALAVCSLCVPRAAARDVSAPAILQYFESRYGTIEDRAPDVFQAGYGSVYTPPPGRADQGDFSVGYDVYDRFDLGDAGRPTLYGTETGLKHLVGEVHKFGDYYVDYIINHNGFSDASTPGFLDAGGYPGMVLQWPGTSDGDFNSAFDWGDVRGRLAGLVDIDHGTNIPLVRHPVPGEANNIPAGTTPAYGRLANVPDDANRRFYPDRDLAPIMVYDPMTGEGDIPIYPFNPADPTAGDPTEENVTGYLMRNAQWLVQVVGVDGFRIDAAKHIEGFALDYFDRAVYRQSNRPLLNGDPRHVFSFSEVYDGNKDYLQTFVKKTIDPAQPGAVGGNRDTLDFPLYFALKGNLENAGTANCWQNIRDASLDVHDDGLHNGSQGVMFVQSHDDTAPWALENVAYAYTLLHPGNAVVYFNAQEFGTGRSDFPKPGRGDALGGAYGDTITRLLDIRNRYGRGDYVERWIDDQGTFVYERSGSCTVGLSNRGDGGFDERKVRVDLPWGTHLVELTGHAADPAIDPYDDIPEVVTVYDDYFQGPTYINVRIPRNRNADGQWHGKGYVVYGLAAPRGTLTLTGASETIPGETPVLDGTADENAWANATTRLADVRVITGDAFEVELATDAVRLLGLDSLRDPDADGDNAMLRIDEGRDLNGNGVVDVVTPGSPAYGFEDFVDLKQPGYFAADGNGLYRQTVDAAALGEGMHYLTVRAYRHRDDGGPEVFQDWKEVLYVDRLDPETAVASFDPTVAGVNENRDLFVRSLDKTADTVHVLLDVGAALDEAAILAMLSAGTEAEPMDRDLFKKYFSGLAHGNHAVTVVATEMTGHVGIQRFGGLLTSTIFGRGLGDLTFDGWFSPDDVAAFETLYWNENATFNPAGDVDGDGWITDADAYALEGVLTAGGADAGTMQAYDAFIATVPEPATLALLAFGAAGLLRRRHAPPLP
jgi:hypothetical protein